MKSLPVCYAGSRYRVLLQFITLGLALVGSFAAAAERVDPITAEPTNMYRPGKVVWADLVTSDVREAAEFYRQVFGWAIRANEDFSYATAMHLGKPVAAFALFEEDAPGDNARWLVSISVSNVDAVVTAARKNGGELLEGPEKLPDRGRFALIRDVRGALFMVLHASGGDPDDAEAAPNEWLWAELLTDDPESSIAFYESVVGYRSVAIQGTGGGEITAMGRDGVARATVVKSPWTGVEPNWLMYLAVEDLTATIEEVRRYGGKVLVPATDWVDGDVAIVADPTGGVFALQQRWGR